MFWIILAIIAWGVVHSLLASLKAKELAKGWLGPLRVRFYRLFYNIFAVLSFLPILGLAAVLPDRKIYAVALPWSGIMVFGQALAVVVLLIGFLQTGAWEFLGLRQLGGDEGDSNLNTSGLYHFIRHPLYTAGLVFIWLLPYMSVNILTINIGLTVYILVGAMFEERKLRRIFGQEYIDYQAVTPMLIPFLKKKTL